MSKHKTMLEYVKSKEDFVCEVHCCSQNTNGKINGGCGLECAEECPFRELFFQVQEENKVNEVHFSNVMSSRLRREIENFNSRKWVNIDIKDYQYVERMLERLSKAISCEEISET